MERNEQVGEGCRKVIRCKYCEHMYVNENMIPVKIISEMGGGGDK
jgi:hypothetical protein